MRTVMAAVLVVGLFDSGCSFSPLVRRAAVDYNRTLEETQNAVLLLNVVRGAKREPIYYTALSKLTGNVSGTAGLNAEFPYGSATVLKPELSLTGGTASFDVAPLDTQDFVRGIMAPISKKLFMYFWSQGWPRDLLLLALVGKIEISIDDNPAVTYSNYPPRHCDFAQYQAVVHDLLDEAKLRFRVHHCPSEVVPAGACSKRVVVSALEKDLQVESPKPGQCRLTKSEEAYELCFGVHCDEAIANDSAYCKTRNRDDAPKPANLEDSNEPTAAVSRVQFAAALHSEPLPEPARTAQRSWHIESSPYLRLDKAKKVSIVLSFRSPEAAMYYLGEIARESEQLSNSAVCERDEDLSANCDPEKEFVFEIPRIKTRTADKEESLPMLSVQSRQVFGSRSRGGTLPAVLEVSHEGRRYSIPDASKCPSQSMHTLSLLNQLIGLQKSSKDLPSQETLTVVPVR